MAGSSQVGTAVIQGKFLVDEHPDVVVTAEGELLVFTIGESGMAFETELLVVLTFPTSCAPVPNSGTVTIPKQAFAIDSTAPSIGIAVLVEIGGLRSFNRHRALGIPLGTASGTRFRAEALNHRGVGGVLNGVESAITPKQRCRRIRIESPTGVSAVMPKGHVVALDLVYAFGVIEQSAEFFLIACTEDGIGVAVIEHRFVIRPQILLDNTVAHAGTSPETAIFTIRRKQAIQSLVRIVNQRSQRETTYSINHGVHRKESVRIPRIVRPPAVIGNEVNVITPTHKEVSQRYRVILITPKPHKSDFLFRVVAAVYVNLVGRENPTAPFHVIPSLLSMGVAETQSLSSGTKK